MTERVLLVDYENIQAVDLQALPEDVKIKFILGSNNRFRPPLPFKPSPWEAVSTMYES
jgi:hypothetical protein